MQGGYWKTPMVVIGRVEDDEAKLRQLEWDAQKFDAAFKWVSQNEDSVVYDISRNDRSTPFEYRMHFMVAYGDYLVWSKCGITCRSGVDLVSHFVSEVTI